MNLRVASLCIVAFLSSADAMADCVEPKWKEWVSLGKLDFAARTSRAFAFQSAANEFIACQRRSLEQRARGRAPADVRQLILQDRVAEHRVFAEAEWIPSCLRLAAHEPDPAVARAKCENLVQGALDNRRWRDPLDYADAQSEQRSTYGGAWSFRTLNLGRPGYCDDAPCDHLFAVEVTNMTPVALKCDVSLTVSNREDGTRRGDQTITIYPGDSLPAARVPIRRPPEEVQPRVECLRAPPFVPAPPVPAACTLNWTPRNFEYPRGLGRTWESGVALLEFTTRQGHKPADAISVVHADSPPIGRAAQAQIEKLHFSTSCPGQRFRIRVEYRAFPCHVCAFEYGVVTLFRDDYRIVP